MVKKSVCQKDRDPEVEARMSSKDKHGGSAQQVEIPDIILDTSTHRKYERGRFLGKVSFVHIVSISRVFDQHLKMTQNC